MVWLRAIVEGFRSSLFFLPVLFVVAGVVLAEAIVAIEASIPPESIPERLRSTVDNARDVLSTIAGATITVAGVVFSVTVVALQLASSQFSPRILRGFMRKRSHQVVLGFVMGTFTYCLLVLRTVRMSGQGTQVVPGISVSVAVALAILTAVAILAFIDRSARSMQVAYLLQDILEEAVDRIGDLPRTATDGIDRRSAGDVTLPEEPGLRVRTTRTGWVQQIDVDGLLEDTPAGSLVALAIRPGVFVVDEAEVLTVWPVPEDAERVEARIRDHVRVGRDRTMQQDLDLGIRQLVDVGIRALSPGVNDLTSAYEAVAHLGGVLRPLLLRDLPPEVVSDEQGRQLVRPHELTHADYIDRAFEQLRAAAARLPSIAVALLGTMGMLRAHLEEAGLTDRIERLARQAHLLVEGVAQAGVLPQDEDEVRRAYEREGFS